MPTGWKITMREIVKKKANPAIEPKELEKHIQKEIMEYLEFMGYVVVKVNNVGIKKPDGQYIPPRKKGISDILACSPDGKFVAIEVKRPGKEMTDEQRLFLERVRHNDGIAFCAKSLDDVMERVK
jgi:hypothetical protein